MIDILSYSEAIAGLAMGSCGWMLATVRRKENRLRTVEDSIKSIEGQVKDINSIVKILLEHQLKS